MQWKWLVTTKLLLAGAAVTLVVGDSLARPGDRLFARRRSQDVTWTTTQPATTVAAQPAAPQPTATATPTTTTTTMQYTTTRRGLFGRRTVGTWEAVPVQTTAQASPAAGQPQAAAPAGEAAPPPAPVAGQQPGTQPAAQAVMQAPSTSPQPMTTRRGLFGRRTATQWYYPTQPAPQTTQQGQTVRQAFYPGNQPAYIEVRLPVANAEIAFNGEPTRQTGTSRLFVTPALDPQKNNIYEVRATWTGTDGNRVDRVENITVPPGGRIVVDLTRPAAGAPQPAAPVPAPAPAAPAPAPAAPVPDPVPAPPNP
jgi:uncharacterized protein (TIGR03000 family)